MTPLTVAVVISTRTLWEQAHGCIQNLPVRIALEESDPSNADDLLDRIERHRVDVVLIETAKLPIPLEEFVQRLHDTSSQPAVFVVHTDPSPQHILETMRAGAREFLNSPLAEPLRDAFERLSVQRSRGTQGSSGGLGQIVGFLAAKGGAGASTFACHVAVEASRRLGQPVLLADFDFFAGIVRFVLKARTTWSVRDALDNLHRMDANYWEKLISKHGKLDLLPAPEDLAARRPCEAHEMAHIMRFIRSTYRLAIIDFGRHYSAAALDALPETEALYLVSTADLDSLECAHDFVEAAMERDFERSRIKVLLNRLPEKNAPDPKGFEEMIGAATAGAFTNDPTPLYDAWSEGRLLDGGSRLGRELNALAAAIVARAKGEDSASQPVKPNKDDTGGLRKWFSFRQKASARQKTSA